MLPCLTVCVSVHSMTLTLGTHIYNSPGLCFIYFAMISSVSEALQISCEGILHQAKTFLSDSFLAICTQYLAPWDLCVALILSVKTQKNLTCKERRMKWSNRLIRRETENVCSLPRDFSFFFFFFPWSCKILLKVDYT